MERAKRTRMEMLAKLRDDKAFARQFMGTENYTLQDIMDKLDALIAEQLAKKTYVNGDYQVIVEDVPDSVDGWPEMIHLSIRREDRDVIRDWRELQAIKNALCGRECEGLEVFPAESRCVDSANQFHLWVFKDKKIRFPFGFNARFVTDDDDVTTIGQRKFTDEQRQEIARWRPETEEDQREGPAGG
jgi:hypothetical protein